MPKDLLPTDICRGLKLIAGHVNLLQAALSADILTKELGQVTACSYYHSSLDLWFLTLALQEIMEMMTTTIPARQQITEKHAINYNLK